MILEGDVALLSQHLLFIEGAVKGLYSSETETGNEGRSLTPRYASASQSGK